MPYYGDPDSVRVLCQNARSLKGLDSVAFDAYIATIDAIVTPMILAELDPIFTDLPNPTSTNGSIMATLWILAMVAEIQEQKFSTNRVGGEPQFAIRKKDAFDEIMAKIKSGRMHIAGATRRGQMIAASHSQQKRLVGRDSNSISDPVSVEGQFNKTKNLRY